MSLKQVVKYINKSDAAKINADITAYKALRDARRTLKKAKDDAFAAMVVVAEGFVPDMSGCVLMQDAMSASFEPKWVRNECGMFDGASACAKTDCKYFDVNQKYFDALAKYNESCKRCRDFWPVKFSRIK